jgi:hypothetical protein
MKQEPLPLIYLTALMGYSMWLVEYFFDKEVFHSPKFLIFKFNK